MSGELVSAITVEPTPDGGEAEITDLQSDEKPWLQRLRRAIDAAVSPVLGPWSTIRCLVTLGGGSIAFAGSEPTDQAEGAQGPGRFGLTLRELEILRQLAVGLTDEEIAERLCISRRTVTTHMSHILAKLDVATRTAAVSRALYERLIRAPPSVAKREGGAG